MKRFSPSLAAVIFAAAFATQAHAADGDGLTSHEQVVTGPTKYPAAIEQSIERLLARPRGERNEVVVDTAIAFGRIGTA